jgi:hypothetical protein
MTVVQDLCKWTKISWFLCGRNWSKLATFVLNQSPCKQNLFFPIEISCSSLRFVFNLRLQLPTYFQIISGNELRIASEIGKLKFHVSSEDFEVVKQKQVRNFLFKIYIIYYYCSENSVWLDLQYCISGFKLPTSHIDMYWPLSQIFSLF